MFSLLQRSRPAELVGSKLFDQDDFYPAFLKDLSKCQHEAIIESPFLTARRLATLSSTLQKLKTRNVRVTVNTRDPLESDEEYMRDEGIKAISILQHMGVQVLYTGNHHRKLAILDRAIIWEGSLNILSQNNSCEVMRRIESVPLAWQMVRFTGIDKRMN